MEDVNKVCVKEITESDVQAPKISVIVPVYKVEKYLNQCIDSILNQTLKDIEIIIVDEGDMDECRAIIDSYEFGQNKDSRIKTIHEKNGGYGASVNKGINIATGEYIGIIESDDFIDSKMFEDLYNLALKFDADMVKSDFYQYITSANQSRKAGRISKSISNKIINAKIDPKILRIGPSVWSAIYKKEFLNKNSIRFLETKGGSYQDTSFSFKAMSLAEKMVFTPNAYLYYRVDNETSSVNTARNAFAICDEFAELTNFVNKHQELKKYVNTEKLIKHYNSYIWNLKRISKDKRKEFIDIFSREFQEFYKNGEIDNEFFKKVNKRHFMYLINDKDRFLDTIKRIILKNELKRKRIKDFSVRINPMRIDIVLFGKQILAKDI